MHNFQINKYFCIDRKKRFIFTNVLILCCTLYPCDLNSVKKTDSMFDQKIYQACKKKDEIFSTLTVKKNNDKKEKRLCCILFRYYSFESRVTSSHRRIRNENFSDFLSVLFFIHSYW